MNESDVMEWQADYVQRVAKLGARNLPPGGEPMVANIVANLPVHPAAIADIGCNTGWVTAELAAARPEASVTGFDVDERMVDQAARRWAERDNIEFATLDCGALAGLPKRFAAVVCAGSSAFFRDRPAVYRAVAAVLEEGGLFIDAQYVYQARPAAELLARERSSFGVTCDAPRASSWLCDYQSTGLSVRTYERFAPFRLPDSAGAALYRSILQNSPEFAPVVDDLVMRRAIARELAPYRAPALFVLDRRTEGELEPPAPVAEALDPQRLAIMSVFAAAVQRRPIDEIRRLNPFEFLAYIGDPDASPGGGRSVARVARWLQAFGLDRAADVIDVGAFTGLSTIVLARDFPKVIGTDIVPDFLSAASTVGGSLGSPAKFQIDDARHSAFAAASLDAVVMTATLGYTPDPEAIVREMHRVLRVGGYLVEFLYDYEGSDAADSRLLQERVSEHLRCRSLVAQVQMFEDEGFVLHRSERLDAVSFARENTEMESWIVASEIERNRRLSGPDVDEFRRLLRRFAGRTDLAGRKPTVHLCAFRKVGANPEERFQ